MLSNELAMLGIQELRPFIFWVACFYVGPSSLFTHILNKHNPVLDIRLCYDVVFDRTKFKMYSDPVLEMAEI